MSTNEDDTTNTIPSRPAIAELAAAAFDAGEIVRMRGMMNTPEKYEDRKAASIAYAEALAAFRRAQLALDEAVQEGRE